MKKTVKLKDVKSSKGKTDWNYLKKSESEVHDAEAPPLSQSELMQMRRAKPSKKH